MILTILIFILILSALVLAHESGHFFAARTSGVKVEEFGVGFPPRLFAKKRGETEYSINILPLGGFVKITGEDGQASNSDPLRNFSAKPLLTKLKILLAGVFLNWILAALILSGLQITGTSVAAADSDNGPNVSVVITQVSADAPAFYAGLKIGDKITAMSLNGKTVKIKNLDDVQNFTRENAGKNITLKVERGKETKNVSITPRTDPPQGQGPIGIAMAKSVKVSYPWYEAPFRGFFLAGSLTISLLSGFWGILHGIFAGQSVANEISGPIGIAALTGQMRSLGITTLLNFVAILSLNLAIINILPFPALDGGRAVLAMLEKVARKPFPARAISLINTAGFVALILLILLVSFKDVKTYL